MRFHCLASALRGALCLSILYAPSAWADTITTWVGGTPSCPTCWNLAANWSNGIPNGAFSVTVNAGGSQPVLDISPSIDNLTLNGTLTVANGNRLTIDTSNTGGVSAINNAGTLLLNSASAFLALSGASGIVNLSGGGTITMNSTNNNIFANNSGMTLNNSSTIQGSGTINRVGTAFTFNNNSGGVINANGSNPLTLGNTIVNAGLLEATNGGTLMLTSANVNNTGGTIGSSGAGSVVQFDNANITGGTLQGQFLQSGGPSTLKGSIALNGILNMANNNTITLDTTSGPMTLTIGSGGGLNMNSTGSITDLAVNGANGTVNLNGTGVLALSNNANNRIYANSTGMTLNNNSTIQGSGQIGLVGQPFTFQNNGTVNANQSAGLTLAGTLVNNGTLEATNGGTLTLANGTLNNSNQTITATGANSALVFTNQAVNNSGGTISTTGGAGAVTLNSTSIAGGTLQSTGGGQFFSAGTSALSSAVTLNGVFNVTNGSVLQFNTNGGTMALTIGAGGGLNLNSTGNNTDLALVGTNGSAFLGGPLTMSNSASNRIYANTTGMTLNNNSTIQGSGQIGVVGQSFIFSNGATGVINANQSVPLILNVPTVNAGLLEATNGGTLSLGGQTINNTGGTISAGGAGSIVQLNGTTIVGGTLQGSSGGVFNSTGNSTLSGTLALNGPLNVGNGSSVTLNTTSGPMTLNFGSDGSLNLNSTDLILSGTNGTVNLNGPVTLSNSASNRIYAASTGMTLNSSSTIQGSGQIGVVGQALNFNNTGTVNANQSAGLSLTGAVVNTSGLLEATNGSTLTLSGTVNNTGSTITANGANTTLKLTNDVVTNTNGIISANGAGSSVQLNGATIVGGTLQASGGAGFTQSGSSSTLRGTVALNGILNVANASGLTLDTTGGPMTLNIGAGGGINFNSTGGSTDLVLSGTGGTVNLNGPVTLSNNANNRIYASSTGMTLNNNSTIQGSGQIGVAGQLFFLKNNAAGVINSNLGTLILNAPTGNAGLLEATNGGTLSLGGQTIGNSAGTISASGAGSVVQLNGTNITGGTLQGNGGGVFNSTGNTTLNSTIALNGILNVTNGASVTVNASGGGTLNIGAGGVMNLNSTGSSTDLILQGTNGTVNLNGPVTLSNSASNRIYAASTGMTLNSSSTIQGAGQIGVVGQALNFNNTGTVNANQSAGLSLTGNVVNTSGLLEATNGSTLTLSGTVNNTGSTITANGANTTLKLTNDVVTNTNGIISANGAGSSVQLNGATIVGGTLQASGGAGFFQSGGYSTLSGTVALNGVLNVANSSGLNLDATGGSMTLNIGTGGGLNLNSTGNNTDLVLVGTGGTVNLNGPVTLSNNANNRIYAASTGMTLNNNSTIQGAGQIGVVGQVFTLNNNASGIVNSNSGTLFLNAPTANAGLLEATNGSTLSLGFQAIGNTAGTISATGAGSIVQLNGSTITGGTLQASGGGQFTSSDATLIGTIGLNGPLNVANASSLTLNATSGPMTLNVGVGGGLNLNSTGNLTDLILQGTNGTVNLNGPVTLSNSAANRIYASNTGMTLNNSGTIQGSGQIGTVGQVFTLANAEPGFIVADQSTPLTFGSTATLSNAGTVESTAGSVLQIDGVFTNFSNHTLTGGAYVAGGVIAFTNADVVHNAANITMIGSGEIEDQNSLNGLRNFVDNMVPGVFALEGGANFTTPGAFSNGGSVDIFGGSIFGTGGAAYTQTGGTTQVDGTLAAGAVNINGGHLKGVGTVNGNVTVASGGAVDPGDSPGTLTIQGNYVQLSDGALDLQFAGPGAGQFSVLDISGAANLSGTLNLTTLAGFTPFNGETFDVMNFASRTGTFTTVNGLNLGNGFVFAVEYDPNDVLLVVNGPDQSAPEPETWMLFGIGVAAIAVSRWRRARV